MTANKENRGDARLVLTKQEAHEIFDFVEMHNVEVSHELCVLLTQMSNKMFPSTAKRTFRDTETIFMEAKYLLARAMRDERLPLIRAATQDIQRELDAYLALGLGLETYMLTCNFEGGDCYFTSLKNFATFLDKDIIFQHPTIRVLFDEIYMRFDAACKKGSEGIHMCLGYGITLKLNEDDTFSYGLLVHAQTYEEGKLLQACVKECEGISLGDIGYLFGTSTYALHSDGCLSFDRTDFPINQYINDILVRDDTYARSAQNALGEKQISHMNDILDAIQSQYVTVDTQDGADDEEKEDIHIDYIYSLYEDPDIKTFLEQQINRRDPDMLAGLIQKHGSVIECGLPVQGNPVFGPEISTITMSMMKTYVDHINSVFVEEEHISSKMYAHIMKQAHDIELICVVVEGGYKIIFIAYVEYGDIVYESLGIHTYSIDALHTLLCRFYPQKKNCLGNILRALLYEPSRVIGGDSNSEDENER